MQNDPLMEWQRLTETYSKMYDDELLELAAESEDLTEQARQVLGDAIRKRGLDAPRAAESARRTSDSMVERAAGAPGIDPDAPAVVSDELGPNENTERPQEYTWKTVLCECETGEEAMQLALTLKRAGIECWIEGRGGSYSPYSQLDQGLPRILVPADRLDDASAIAAKPIPKEIVEESKIAVPEFEAPVCPRCGAEDPVLEGVDPFNTWFCEACENEWTESGAEGSEEPDRANKGH